MAKRIDPKADRKRKLEELKRQQRAKERRKTIITVVIAALLGLALIGMVVVPAVLKSRRTADSRKAAAREAKRPVADFGVKLAAAGCGEEQVDNPLSPAGQHVDEGQKVDYKASPPDAGQHTGTATLSIRSGFYARSDDAPPEHAVHSLEHGVVIGWYDKTLPADQLKDLQKAGAAAADKHLRFIAVPWSRSTFADNKPFVLTSWGHTQRCGKVSGQAIDAFVKKNADGKDAPERGGQV